MIKRTFALAVALLALTGGSAFAQNYAPMPIFTNNSGVAIAAQGVKDVNPASFYTGQLKIAVTGTAVCLPAQILYNGVTIRSLATNTAMGAVGGSGVTNTVDGTGNGAIIQIGEAIPVGVIQASTVCVNGTANDIYSYWGN